MRSRPCSLPVVSLLPAPGCLSFPTRTWGRKILADGSCTDADAPRRAVSSGTGAAVGTGVCSAGGLRAEQHWEGSGKASREGSLRQSPPRTDPREGTDPPAPTHRPAQPHGGKDLAPGQLPSRACDTHV